jgi:nucleotidyltransferase/DNA polymerase involved in DNA repair
MERQYIAIDLKSYYASVECNERGLDPLTTNLVVADESRTEKTICLAVSPSLKSFGVPGRPRLFEVVERVREINAARRKNAPGRELTGESSSLVELQAHPELALSYIVAKPRMSFYIDYSTLIYEIYLRYVSPEDIQVYSIDEVFIDATRYLNTYRTTARDLAMKMIRDVLHRRHRDQSLSRKDRDGHRGEKDARGRGRRAHRGAGRAVLPRAALDPPTADELLARRPRHRVEAGGARHLHDGRYRARIALRPRRGPAL